MAERDYVKAGEYYTADYMRFTNLDESATFRTMFDLVQAHGKSASDSDVMSMVKAFPTMGKTDASSVFHVVDKNPQKFFKSL